MNDSYDTQDILMKLATLNSHYGTFDVPEWAEEVATFEPEVVAIACREWRRGPEYRRRPGPGDIRDLCIRIEEAHKMVQAAAEMAEARKERRLQ